ncbi:MAG: manganese-binding transcriptional regulator MntR [Planctomycetota bacterium]|nr:manganese-binding transcriptional regulator MntR [Planctomycetota bacterium]
MAKLPKVNRHQRTRADHSTELAEDYVEAVAELIEAHGSCRVTDLAEYFDVSHVTVNRAVARFQRAGWVTTKPYGPIELTKQGTQLAESSRRRHAIVYQFLLALGVDEKTAATDAEGIEHHVSPETLQRMEQFAKQANSKSR